MVFVALSVTYAKAQTSLIATLNHEGTLSTFYGSTALQQAHEAAADGDVITLSSGTFASVDITKAITLRGASMAMDAETQTEPTVLSNAFSIDIADETTQRLTIEGIYSNQTVNIKKLSNAMFLKSRFSRIEANTGYVAKDINVIHCRFSDGYFDYNEKNSASFINCIIMNTCGKNNQYKNCIIGGNGRTVDMCENSEYKNCILMVTQTPGSTITMYNNLVIDTDKNYFQFISNNTNIRVEETDERTKTLFGYSDDKDYKLTEEAKAIMKGTDGTEVGIYGGNLPYDPTPTNPQITKFDVASKTTADGKLSVDIEVKSAE